MPQYGLSLSKPAADFLRNLDRNDQERVRHILSLIQTDPHIDGLIKHVYLMPPLVYTVYDHPQWWVVYHLVGHSIRVVSIERAD
jgi:hypothetical protein